MNMRIALAFCALAALAPAQAADEPRVTQTGFCINRTETGGCGEVALPGTFVDIARLQKRADGTRIVAFFSFQNAALNTAFVHVLEAEDAESKIETTVLPANGAKLGDLSKPLAALGNKYKGGGHIVLTPFRAAGGDAPARVFSEITVRGPGVYNATVVDITGKPLPGGEKISFNVSRAQ